MSRKIKLVKKTADVQQPEQPLRDFVAKSVRVEKEDYVLDVSIGNQEQEVTTIDNLRAAKAIMKIDQRAFRAGIRRIDQNNGGATGMSTEEKLFAGLTFAFSNPADLLTEVPEVRDRIWNGMSDLHEPSVFDRMKRFRYASSIIYNTVDSATAKTVVRKMTTTLIAGNINIWLAYVEFGLEGTTFDASDGEAIMDYILSVVGTAFGGAGLLEDIQNNMQPTQGNLSAQEVITAIENVLIEGIYEIV